MLRLIQHVADDLLRLATCVFVLAGCLGWPTDGHAQDVRTLVIRQGVVEIDGQKVPASRWPTTLRVDSLSLHFVFSGDREPLVDIGPYIYRVEANQLVVVDEVSAWDRRAAHRVPSAPDSSLGRLLELLRLEAQEAVETAKTVSERPRTAHFYAISTRAAPEETTAPVQAYVEKLRTKEAALYERLTLEWRLEEQARREAHRVAALAAGAERQAAEQALRVLLEELFVLKQQNLQDELTEMQARLDSMQANLDARSAARNAIVQQRLDELLDYARTHSRTHE
ncbi:MAG: hypothetical protein AAGI71_02635 [Bacteroidota bacterium]